MLQFYIKGYEYVLCMCDALFSEDNFSVDSKFRTNFDYL